MAQGEVCPDVEGRERGFKSGEHVSGAIRGVALDNGEGAVLWTKKMDGLDDAPEESGKERKARAEVEGEEVRNSGASGGWQLEVSVPRGVECRTFELREGCIGCVEDRVDEGCYGLRSEYRCMPRRRGMLETGSYSGLQGRGKHVQFEGGGLGCSSGTWA